MLIPHKQDGFTYLEALIAVSLGWMVCHSILEALNTSARQLVQSTRHLQKKRAELSFDDLSLQSACAPLQLLLAKSALVCQKPESSSDAIIILE